MTVKDQFNIAGVDTTLGYVGRSFKPAVDDAVLVWMLRSLGALIIAKSNLPQSIMVRTIVSFCSYILFMVGWLGLLTLRTLSTQWCETENPLWGLTTHPLHKGYTPGGSTGGEAALLSQGASLLGWGTDIGGSIRIPAHMMGIYGFKPTVSPLFESSWAPSIKGMACLARPEGPRETDSSIITIELSPSVQRRSRIYRGPRTRTIFSWTVGTKPPHHPPSHGVAGTF